MIKPICFGDSWLVDLPFGVGTGGGLGRALFRNVLGLEDWKSVAHAGDSTETMMGHAMVAKLVDQLPGCNLMLVSMGGDDFAGDQFREAVNDYAPGMSCSEAVNSDWVDACLSEVIADYRELLAIRDKLAPSCLLVTHSYDFPPPDHMGRGFLTLGPWLQPGLQDRGWTDPKDQAAIVAEVLKMFEARMAIFAAGNRLHIHVKTQGTVQTPEHWANELHLNTQGCLVVAKSIHFAILPWIDDITA